MTPEPRHVRIAPEPPIHTDPHAEPLPLIQLYVERDLVLDMTPNEATRLGTVLIGMAAVVRQA